MLVGLHHPGDEERMAGKMRRTVSVGKSEWNVW